MAAHVFSLILSFGATCTKDREKSPINSYQGFLKIQILIYFLIELVDTAKLDKLFFFNLVDLALDTKEIHALSQTPSYFPHKKNCWLSQP